MRLSGAFAIVVLVAAVVAGCGGGSTSTGAGTRGANGPKEGLFEDGGPGPPPADGRASRVRGGALEVAEARHVEEGEMVAEEEGWVRSGVGVFWTPDGGRTWHHSRLRGYDKFVIPASRVSFSLALPPPEAGEISFETRRRGWLAGFHARLAPGRAVLLSGPTGSYLGLGNHTVGGVTAVDIRLDRKARCEAPKPPPCPRGP